MKKKKKTLWREGIHIYDKTWAVSESCPSLTHKQLNIYPWVISKKYMEINKTAPTWATESLKCALTQPSDFSK